MKLFRFAFIFLFFLSPAFAEDIRTVHSKSIAACKAKLNSGGFSKRVDFAACVNLANAKAWLDKGRPNFDLFEYASKRELLAAHRLDTGQFSEAEYWAARAQIKSELYSSVTRRNAEEAIAAPRAPITCYHNNGITNCY